MAIRPVPFPGKNGEDPFNASGVARVGPRRFVFVDNNDPGALFELHLDAGFGTVERIHRRRLAGLRKGELRDPEGLTPMGDGFLVVTSSLSARPGHGGNDGLVRVRYAPDGDLPAEVLPGFREWLLEREPTLADAGRREPDAGGLNVEGLAWDPVAGALLFGLRGPVSPGRVTIVRVPVDPGGPWTTASLGTPDVLTVEIPRTPEPQGIRDLAYDDETGEFLLLLGRSASRGDTPFRLAAWARGDERVRPGDAAFHKTAKPEGVTAFSAGGRRLILVVDDTGGYVVLDQEKYSFDAAGS